MCYCAISHPLVSFVDLTRKRMWLIVESVKFQSRTQFKDRKSLEVRVLLIVCRKPIGVCIYIRYIRTFSTSIENLRTTNISTVYLYIHLRLFKKKCTQYTSVCRQFTKTEENWLLTFFLMMIAAIARLESRAFPFFIGTAILCGFPSPENLGESIWLASPDHLLLVLNAVTFLHPLLSIIVCWSCKKCSWQRNHAFSILKFWL